MTDIALDPRPLYRDALAWVADLMEATRDDQMTLPTPCPDFDVRALLGHQIAGVRRARTMALGGDPTTVPVVLTGFDDATAAYRVQARLALEAWAGEHTLDMTVTAPWGTVPGRAAVWAYINETLVHGWDLAVSTGRPSEAEPRLVEPVLAAAARAIPAEPRDVMPFGEVVEPAADAGPTERLVNWSGRASAPWLGAASR